MTKAELVVRDAADTRHNRMVGLGKVDVDASDEYVKPQGTRPD